jgi:hypothetical protein
MDTNRINHERDLDRFQLYQYYNMNSIPIQLATTHTIHQAQGLTLD